jgi:hypothetical protein
MVSFEIFVKSMPPSSSELKVKPSFCFAFKIPDDVTTTNNDFERNGITHSNQIYLVTFTNTKLTQASFLQKIKCCKMFL